MSVSEKHIGKVMKAGSSQKEIEYLTQTIKQRRYQLHMYLLYRTRFVLAAVDCILQKIAADFEVTCSEEHKRSALVGFSDIIQSNLAIDPVTCKFLFDHIYQMKSTCMHF